MKKAFSLLLALVLLLSLAGCGSESKAPDPNAGLYEAVTAEMSGFQIGVDSVFEDGFSLELKDGGKATFHYDGKDYSMKWALEDGAFHAEGGGAELDGTLSDGVMVLENVLDSGISITLECDAILNAPVQAAPAPETGKAAGESAAAAQEPSAAPEQTASRPAEEPAPTAEPQPTEPPEPVLAVWESFPGTDADGAIAMSNFMADPRCLVEDGVFYGRFFIKNRYYAAFVRMDLEEQADKFVRTGYSILDMDHFPEHIYKLGDSLYFVCRTGGRSENLGIYRMQTDGSGMTCLYEGDCSYLAVVDGRLVFTDPDGRLVSTDLDGGDLRLILDREVYYPWFIDPDWLIFQDDADNESLHLLHLPDQVEFKLNDTPSYHPVISGTDLFYAVYPEGSRTSVLAHIDLSRYDVEPDPDTGYLTPVFTEETGTKRVEYVLSDGEKLWSAVLTDPVAPENWRELEGPLTDYGYYSMYVFFSRDLYMNDMYGKNKNVSEVWIVDRNNGVMNTLPWVY